MYTTYKMYTLQNVYYIQYVHLGIIYYECSLRMMARIQFANMIIQFKAAESISIY